MVRVRFAGLSLVVASAIGACSLDEFGLSNDAGVDANTDGGDDCGCTTIPSGWQLVTAGPGDFMCAPGHTKEQIVWAAEAGAGQTPCDCSCDPPTATCSTGTLSIGYGNGACTFTATDILDGGCLSFSPAGLPDHLQASSLTGTAGACQSHVITTPDAMVVTSGTLCGAQTTCDPDLCASGQQLCIVHSGVDGGCPGGTPFQQQHVIGGSFAFTCSACACDIPHVTCGETTLTYFTDPACGSALTSLGSDAGCVANGVGNTLVSGLRASAPVIDAGCAPDGERIAMPDYGSNGRTLCCK